MVHNGTTAPSPWAPRKVSAPKDVTALQVSLSEEDSEEDSEKDETDKENTLIRTDRSVHWGSDASVEFNKSSPVDHIRRKPNSRPTYAVNEDDDNHL
jgi:hypothetical protein